MTVDWPSVVEKVAVGILGAIALGALTLAWNWVSGGGVIRAMGGVTVADFAGMRPAPTGAVVAFDLRTCPTGWSPFRAGMSRVIVGAADSHSTDVPNLDMNRKRLTARPYGTDGGEEMHQVTVDEMPPHSHAFQGQPVSAGGWGGPVSRNVGVGDHVEHRKYVPEGQISTEGKGVPGNNMPPFIALHFCTKD